MNIDFESLEKAQANNQCYKHPKAPPMTTTRIFIEPHCGEVWINMIHPNGSCYTTINLIYAKELAETLRLTIKELEDEKNVAIPKTSATITSAPANMA